MPQLTSLPIKLASIFDRADGSSPTLGGIAEPLESIKINDAYNTIGANGETIFFYELSDSPQIESAEQSTIVHRFHCDYLTAQMFLVTNPRGTYLTDQYGNTSRVLSTKIDPVSHTGVRACILTVTSEGQQPLFPSPPDEFDIESVEINPAAQKHPRYAGMTYGQKWAVRNANAADNYDHVQTAMNTINAPGLYSGQNESGVIVSNVPPYSFGTIAQVSQSFELLYKEFKGEDSFYLAGYKVTWSQYYWFPQILNPGGYIEDPVFGGGLPAYFWSTDGTINGNNIFSQTTTHNPNLFPSPSSGPPYGLSWLRQADTQHLQRTWWRVTRSWIGAPLGQWDYQWYGQFITPYQSSITTGVVLV